MATDPSEFWERRRDLTPSPVRPVVADGDRQLALLVDVADPDVLAGYRALRERLDGFDCLGTTPPEELHLTVKLFDHAVPAGAVEDASAVTAAEVDDAVAGLAAEFDPFEAAFPRLNLFPDAVYAEVDAGGALTALNRRLCDREWAATSGRDRGGFLPHLTLGYFTGDREFDALVGFLEANREPSMPATTVSELSLVAHDLTSPWRSATTTIDTYGL